MKRYRFSMAVPAHKLQDYYRGAVRHVVVNAEQGHRLQIPLHSLRRFISRDGIHGRFLIELDDENRLIRIERLEG